MARQGRNAGPRTTPDVSGNRKPGWGASSADNCTQSSNVGTVVADHHREPTQDEIRQRAYEIFLARGTPGDPMVDWLQAERELRTRYAASES